MGLNVKNEMNLNSFGPTKQREQGQTSQKGSENTTDSLIMSLECSTNMTLNPDKIKNLCKLLNSLEILSNKKYQIFEL